MAVFSQARFGEVDPNITIQRVTAPVDTTAADAIDAFGQVGGQIRQGLLQGELKRKLGEQGNMIATINAGEEAIRDASEQGQIDTASKQFMRLAAATEQGKISEQRAALEAEVLLRQSISMAPGWADQLRKTARDVLRFDPTGGALNALYLSGPDADDQRVTQEMKDLEQADTWVANGFAKTREEALKYIVGARVAKVRDEVDARRIKQGEINAGRVAVIAAQSAQEEMNGVMANAFAEVRQSGGVQNVEEYIAGLRQAGEKVKAQYEQNMASSEQYLYKPDHYEAMTSRIDELVEANIATLQDQDLAKIMSRNQEMAHDIMTLTGIAIAPDVALMNEVGGQAAVTNYLEMMAAAGGDQRTLEELTKINPQYGFLADLSQDAQEFVPGLRAAARGQLGAAIEKGEVTPEVGKTIARKEGLDVTSGRTSPEEIGRIVNNLADTDQPIAALSTVAQTPDSHFHMNNDDRVKVTDNFRNTHNQQVDTLSKRLSQHGYGLAWDGQRFVVQSPDEQEADRLLARTPGNTISGMGFTAGGGVRARSNALAREAGVTEQLDLLNNTMLSLAKDRRWAQEFGYNDANEWANSLMNSVNLGAAEIDMARGGESLFGEHLDMADQANLRQALRDGNIDQAIDVLTQAKIAGQQVSGVGNAPMFEQAPVEAGRGQVIRPVVSGEGSFVSDIPGVTAQPAGAPSPVQFEDQFQAEVAMLEGLHTVEDFNRNNTVGFGRDLSTNPLQPEDYELIGLEQDASNQEVAEYLQNNPEAAQALFSKDLREVRNQLSSQPGINDTFNNLPPEKQDIVTNMAYQMGAAGVAGFENMWSALEQGDYVGAAREMLDSQWANQTPRRARLLARQMIHGRNVLSNVGR